MLKQLTFEGVGPAQALSLSLGSRLNVITGDNGVGKSLLLDTAWYALTATWPFTWPGKGVIPTTKGAKISWLFRDQPTEEQFAEFNFVEQSWDRKSSEDIPALVVFARVDGGFSVYDPYRTGHEYRYPFGQKAWGPSSCLQFTPEQVWEGLPRVGSPAISACEGMLRDWQRWALDTDDQSFDIFSEAVTTLSKGMRMVPQRSSRRVFIDDALDIPLLETETGLLEVVHASAAMKRILAFAYMVVWAQREHRIIAKLQQRAPFNSIVIIFDEIESHLHPQWQRRIAPSLLRLGDALSQDTHVQAIVTTHSPLVLASLETLFDRETDRLFNLEIAGHHMVANDLNWTKQGDAVNWLVSESFGLQQGRSVEAERAIEAAEAWMRNDHAELVAPLDTQEAIHAELLRVLADHDDFWPRWIVETRKITA